MESLLNTLGNKVLEYLRLKDLLKFLHQDTYDWMSTWAGVKAIVFPLLVGLLFLEIVVALRKGTFRVRHFSPHFLTYIFNQVLRTFIAFASYPVWLGLFQGLRPFESDLSWYWFVYAFLVFDLALYLLHFAMHKVRLLWCIHAPHHSAEYMSTVVNRTNFYLNEVYLSFFRTLFCMLMGVNPVILLIVVAVEGMWVHFVHISEDVLKRGRLGLLDRILISPSLHRVHHARNPLYIDTNYANLFSLWDWVFGTLQPEDDEEKIEYGITRKINSFTDFYFGEAILLWKDVVRAPTWLDKVKYVVMPPGWKHVGDYKTGTMVRGECLEQQRQRLRPTASRRDAGERTENAPTGA